jgi:hypothetical protein
LGAHGDLTGPSRAQIVVGRVGRICAVAFVPIAVMSAIALPGNTTGTDWGTFVVFLIIFAVLVAVPLWIVATGVSSANRSTRRICGWVALAGVVLPIVAMVGDWSGNNWSGRLGDAIIWIPIVAIYAAMFVATLIADRRSSVAPETHRV